MTVILLKNLVHALNNQQLTLIFYFRYFLQMKIIFHQISTIFLNKL
jgi:hypothetical protein